jgi:hypothetical protein
MRLFTQLFTGGPRLAAVFAIAAGVAGGTAYYGFFVAQQARYLEGRNFRLLGALAAQTQGASASEAKRFESLAREFKSDTWKYFRTRRYRAASLPESLPNMTEPEATYALQADRGEYAVRIVLRDNAAVPRDSANANRDVNANAHIRTRPETSVALRIPLPLIVEPIFKPKLAQSAFDTIGLATQSGKTWFAAGHHASELLASRLDTLMRAGTQAAPNRPFAEIVQTMVLDLSIGGVRYKLFAQPCCAFPDNAEPMMVIGLVEADVFRARSWAISTTLVKAAMLVILLAVVLFPFIKLACLGPRQRVRAFDAFQIAVSSVAALGLFTIAALDTYAYWRLNRATDEHLQTLADTIQTNFRTEIEGAAAQLACLEQVTVPKEPGAFGDMLMQNVRVSGEKTPVGIKCDGTVKDLSARSSDARLERGPDWPYPYFESFSRIDSEGKQAIKIATTRWVQSRIQVGPRRYVTDLREHKAWKDDALCPTGCVLESLWAWTSGEPQAVLSKRAAIVDRNAAHTKPAKGDIRRPDDIAALALYLPSVIRPVLPPGFEFAVIDDSGDVWFHSDRHRNAYENFFAESDDNRRLRAQVLAHSAESLELQYWGASYRAYVKPLGLFDLSVVTLFQKENSWALDREWLVVAILLLAAYLVFWVIALVVAFAPDDAWIWPDPARRPRYVAVSAVSCVILIVALIVAARVHGTALLWWAYGLPLAGWIATFALLRRRPSRAVPATSCEPVAAYSVAAWLFLLASAVAPAVLFFAASFQLHVQSYIKRSDFQLVRALAERDTRLRQEYSEERGRGRQTYIADGLRRSRIDQYYEFFCATKVTEPSASAKAASSSTPAHGHDERSSDDFLLGLLEAWLPYYAEASVEWRELLHDHAGDQSWSSEIDADGLLTMRVTPTSRQQWTLTSAVPALVSIPRVERGAATHMAMILGAVPSIETTAIGMISVLFIVIAGGMVVYLMPRLFLTGVGESLRTNARITAGTSDKVFVLCESASKQHAMLGAMSLAIGPIARHADSDAALQRALANIAQVEDGATLLIDDLDADLDQPRLMMRKLAVVRQLAKDPLRAVIVRSAIAPQDLVAIARRVPSAARTPEDRWSRALDAFEVIDWRDGATSSAGAAPILPQLDRVLATEGRGHPHVQQICDRLRQSAAVRDGTLSERELLDEIGERAASCYRRLWDSCSDEEQIVLANVARDGWVHLAAFPVVRRLLGRRLLRKDPSLRLMNATFCCFVVSLECRDDVKRLESAAGVSHWDRMRVPFGVVVVGAAVFLFATQRELYNAIYGLTTTAAVSVPSLIKAIGILAGRVDAGGPKAA